MTIGKTSEQWVREQARYIGARTGKDWRGYLEPLRLVFGAITEECQRQEAQRSKLPTSPIRRLERRLNTLRRLLIRYGHLDEVLALDEAWGEFRRDCIQITLAAKENKPPPSAVFRAHHYQHLDETVPTIGKRG